MGQWRRLSLSNEQAESSKRSNLRCGGWIYAGGSFVSRLAEGLKIGPGFAQLREKQWIAGLSCWMEDPAQRGVNGTFALAPSCLQNV